MNERAPLSTAKLSSFADVNPENLGAATRSDFVFRYVDLSSVSGGRIQHAATSVCTFGSAPSRARRRLRSGDVLFGTVRPAQRSHALFDGADDTAVASTGFAVLRARPGEGVSNFLRHFVLSDDAARQAHRSEVGSGYPAVNEVDVSALALPRFGVEEQRRIAEVLDTVDEAIHSTERMRAKARSAHRALAAVLLNADAPFVALGRLVSDVTSGGTPTSGDPRYYADHGTPFAKIDDLTRAEGRLLTSTQQHLTDAGLRESSARIYPAGTILVSMYGTIGLSKTLASAMAGNQALAALMPPFGCDGDYLALQLEHSRSSLERLATQTTQPNISGRSVRAFKVRVPPLEAQRQIVAVMDSAEWHVATLARRIVQLQQLRAGLADDLLTGRVRTVPV